MSTDLLDQSDRLLAVSTFDRNIVVTAGAGTGKTTLLIQRMLHLLMREPAPLKLPELVALTFTNKAANEMKLRLRDALGDILSGDENSEVIAEMKARYRLSITEIENRAKEALRQMERGQMTTIHSFAAACLHLYPLEAGLDPLFQVGDDKADFSLFFKEKWSLWLACELSERGEQKTLWLEALEMVSLEEIAHLAFLLAKEGPLLNRLGKVGIHSPVLEAWLKNILEESEMLRDNHPENRKIEKGISLAGKILEVYLSSGNIPADLKAAWKQAFGAKGPTKAKGWNEADFEQAKRLFKITQSLTCLHPASIQLLIQILTPFLEAFKKDYLKQGFVSYNELLVKTRDLLKNNLAIRADFKGRYKSILVDEFQDTDPVQYEILLYLSEDYGTRAIHWQKLRLVPGKLFVVGDPKQSIYGFRQADIGAYERVKKMILEQGGLHCTLRTNFRSQASILRVVNGLFDQIMQGKEGLQADYVPIHAPPEKEASAKKEALFRGVSLRVLQAQEGDFDADMAREAEGVGLAKWLSEDLIGHKEIQNKKGEIVKIRKQDIVILMRSLSQVHHYLEPLRRRGIRYVVEGEKRFYATQEVIDAVNLLRVIADPADALALVGLLRSPLGGFDDAEIYAFHQSGVLECPFLRQDLESQDFHPRLKALYLLINRLRLEAAVLPVSVVVEKIFHETPIRLLAAATMHGEQALANLEKLQREAASLGAPLEGRFKHVVATLAKRVSEEEEAGEAALAEEGLDAVRIYTIHTAKGLEFPVVILAGTHTVGPSNKGGGRIALWQDWSSGLVGLRLGEFWDLSAIFLADRLARRALAEEKRLLYVAMTRARDHLVFSAAPVKKGRKGSILSLLEEGMASFDVLGEERQIPLGEGVISKTLVRAEAEAQKSQAHSPPPEKKNDWKSIQTLWQKRHREYESLLNRPLFISPSRLKRHDEATLPSPSFSKPGEASGESGRLIGQLAHRFLEAWDFSSDLEAFRKPLSHFLSKQVIHEESISLKLLTKELEAIFQVFFHSEPYQEICQSKIIGREMPFLMPWEGRIMEGFIDLIYEKDGTLVIVEYKSDRTAPNQLARAAEKYRHQSRIYPEALRQALKREAIEMKMIFLRIGESISLTQASAGEIKLL